MELEDIILWPDGDYCQAEDLESYGFNKSDDYRVVDWDSLEAAMITGALEDGCKALFDHRSYTVLNDTHMSELLDYLGIAQSEVFPRHEKTPDIGFWHWMYHHTFG